MTKASRDMLHRSIALECDLRASAGTATVKTLSFAPGPLDTDMQAEIRRDMPPDSELSQVFQTMHQKGELLDPAWSAAKLAGLLAQSSFTSGVHIDVYDC
jgi:sepiapterin reductase